MVELHVHVGRMDSLSALTFGGRPCELGGAGCSWFTSRVWPSGPSWNNSKCHILVIIFSLWINFLECMIYFQPGRTWDEPLESEKVKVQVGKGWSQVKVALLMEIRAFTIGLLMSSRFCWIWGIFRDSWSQGHNERCGFELIWYKNPCTLGPAVLYQILEDYGQLDYS